jgi:hypothetical protein
LEASQNLTAEVGGWCLEISPALELQLKKVPVEASSQNMRFMQMFATCKDMSPGGGMSIFGSYYTAV